MILSHIHVFCICLILIVMEVHLKTLRFEYTRSSEHNSHSIDFFLNLYVHAIPSEHPMFITSICLSCIAFSCEYNTKNGNSAKICRLHCQVFIVIYCCRHRTYQYLWIHSCLQHDSEMRCDAYNVQVFW